MKGGIMIDLYSVLKDAAEKKAIPRIVAHNRIDGPGSSLDLKEFQQCFWNNLRKEEVENEDKAAKWSKNMPRTVGISINLGCVAEAYPLEDGKIGVESHDYGTELIKDPGEIPYDRKYWLLKTLELFNVKGVRVVLHNLIPGIRSSGLGGSATATTAVCLLANKLTGEPFTEPQIVAIASSIEQDMGISITGTQEQSCVVYGGIRDYVWFPWGIPGKEGGYGSSIRYTLLSKKDYLKIENRLSIFHSGKHRMSSDVNAIWRSKLRTHEGLKLHGKKLSLAYEYREGLRTQNWERVNNSIKEYRIVRTQLCSDYMCDVCWEIQGQCERFGAESFPLGAGGGGALMIFCPDPSALNELTSLLEAAYRKIDFNICTNGHEFINIPC